MSKPWIEEKLGGDPKQVMIPGDDKEPEENPEDGADENTGEEPVKSVQEENIVPDSESYRHFFIHNIPSLLCFPFISIHDSR